MKITGNKYDLCFIKIWLYKIKIYDIKSWCLKIYIWSCIKKGGKIS